MSRIFPLQIVSLEPSNLRTADCHFIGEGDDGIAYAIKRVSDGEKIPASEFICSTLAQSCRIAIPPFEIAELSSSEKVFASRWEDGVFPPERATALLMGIEPMEGLLEDLSAVYAFDIFVYNVDRHFGNYMFRNKQDIGSRPVLLASDYSRAFLYHGLLPPVSLLPDHCNTANAFNIWSKIHGFSQDAARMVLEQLKMISDINFENVLSRVPSEWLSSEEKESLVEWWQINAGERVQLIEKGLSS